MKLKQYYFHAEFLEEVWYVINLPFCKKNFLHEIPGSYKSAKDKVKGNIR